MEIVGGTDIPIDNITVTVQEAAWCADYMPQAKYCSLFWILFLYCTV